MDTAFVTDVTRRMAFEAARTEPPAGFPKLPDLPLARYTDETFFRLELAEVFRRTWLFAGHISEFPEAGSYKLLDVPYAPVVVARGHDGELRAFLNACRHRGAPVVRDVEGVTRLFVCQFHSWSYDLSGRLVRVPEARDFVGLVPEERALPNVRCETWGGFVFVNLDHDAPPLLEYVAPLRARYGDLMERPYRFVTRQSRELGCNWKIALEAFLEIYHVKTVHARSAAFFLDPPRGVMLLHPHGHSSLFTPYQEGALTSGSQALDLFFPPDVPKVEEASPFYTEANLSFLTFPNLVTPTDVSGFPILLFWPLATNRTRFDMVWYGVDWGDGPRPEGWEVKLAAWNMLMDEDFANLEPIQASVEAAAHRGVPLSYQERRIWQFHADVDHRIGSERIPEELRVPDLLADYIEP